MKKMLMMMAMMLTIAASASAMTYAEARREALFLTDKMAYELNLTDYQYEQVYEINLGYLRYIDRTSVYGNPWTLRNRQLANVLTANQYRLYEMANYFYRPVSWSGTTISFSVYTRYADRSHFYRPAMRQTLSRRTGTNPPPRPAVQPGVRPANQPGTRPATATRTQPATRGGTTKNANSAGNFGGQRK